MCSASFRCASSCTTIIRRNSAGVSRNTLAMRISRLALSRLPWTRETVMLILKYPNVYADTALLYFDSPKQFFQTTFNVQLGEYWIDRMLYDKVMFGSTYPRIEQKRMVKAVDSLTLRPLQRKMVMGLNAEKFIGLEG